MNTNTWKSTLTRAARTFFQAAFGYAAATLTGLIGAGEDMTSATLGALAVSAIAAGLAALMNLPQKDTAIGLSGASGSSGTNDTVAGDGGGTPGEATPVRRKVESIEELPLAGQTEPGDCATAADGEEARDDG